MTVYRGSVTPGAGSTIVISADEVPIEDAGALITATDVEGALQENRALIDSSVQKDTSGNITVGHTSDIEAVSTITAASTYTPDLALEHPKRADVSGSFTLARPLGDAYSICKLELTVTGAGGYTLSTTNINIVDGSWDGTTGKVNLITVEHWDTSTSADVYIRQRV